MIRTMFLPAMIVIVFAISGSLCESTTSPSDSPGESALHQIFHSPETELSDEERIQKRSPLAYNFGLGKKNSLKYSDFKRLPSYNFGLGKRAPSYDFGLGKRSLGESSSNAEDFEDNTLNYDDAAANPEYYAEDEESNTNGIEEKRARPYSFGLGKRDIEKLTRLTKSYDFGLGKRAAYEFGLGKRSPYEFGLGKRQAYEFGLGKRAAYEFGLGKKADYTMQPEQRFDLGSGRRQRDLSNRSQRHFDTSIVDLGKRIAGIKTRQIYDYGLGRRQRDLNRFNFGLGKRSSPPTEERDDQSLY